MPTRRPRFTPFAYYALACLVLGGAGVHAQYGPILTGAGPVSRSMSGAETAAPLSPSGALFWNPATIAGFRRSEVDVGLEYLMPRTRLDARYPANSLGLGLPPVGFEGSRRSDTPGFALPNVGVVYVPDESRLVYGVGVFGVAGLGVDYAGDATHPLLSAPPPNGLGFGPIYSEFQVLQVAPAVAYRLTDRLSVAAGPTISLATLKVDPGLFLPPDDANGDGFASYPAATHGPYTWGGGYTLGLFYQGECWNFGGAYRSQQWFDRFRYNTADELGRPRRGAVELSLPPIVTLGVAYTGFDRLLLSADVRYLGFSRTRLFGDSGFRPDGSLNGLGWRDSFVTAVGGQYRLTDAVTARAGYAFSTNPIPDSQAGVNVASPTILEHSLSAGVSWAVTEDLTVSAAYVHFFRNSIEGRLQLPAGAVPGTSVRNTAAGYIISAGASFKFGRKPCDRCAPAGCPPVRDAAPVVAPAEALSPGQ